MTKVIAKEETPTVEKETLTLLALCLSGDKSRKIIPTPPTRNINLDKIPSMMYCSFTLSERNTTGFMFDETKDHQEIGGQDEGENSHGRGQGK
jgi:hypothetical protein